MEVIVFIDDYPHFQQGHIHSSGCLRIQNDWVGIAIILRGCGHKENYLH